ncbi:MAG: cyclic nucleotide-binding domain-containing protein [Spirochaetota bacterium]
MELGHTRIAEAGDVIFKEGGAGDLMFILIDGEIEIRKKVGKSETVLKSVSEANDIFGEMALIDGRSRSASAIAVRKSKYIAIDGSTFENLILTNGKFALKIIKVLSDRIRNSNSTIGELIEFGPRERFLRGLVDYAFKRGQKIFDGRLKVPIRDFRVWANSRMGFSLEDTDLLLTKLLRSEVITWAPSSAKTNEDIIVPETTLREFDRRDGLA